MRRFTLKFRISYRNVIRIGVIHIWIQLIHVRPLRNHAVSDIEELVLRETPAEIQRRHNIEVIIIQRPAVPQIDSSVPYILDIERQTHRISVFQHRL